MGVTAAVGVVFLLAGFLLLRHLGCVVDGESTQTLATPQGSVERIFTSVRVMLWKALPLTTIKIIVVVWQLLFQFSALARDVFPEEYEQFLSYISFVNFDLSVVMSYSCLVSPNFHGRLLVATITPILVLAILGCAYCIGKVKYQHSRQCIITLRRRHLSAALSVVFFVYSSTSSTIFQTFPCQDVGAGSSVKADHSVPCTSNLHRKFMVYAGAMAIVYPIGIPFCLCWWIVRNRKGLKRSDRDTIVHLQPFSGIWNAYIPSRYYFELVEYFRRLTLSISSVFLVPDSVDNIAIVLSLAVVFLFVSESLSPFKNSVDMMIYRWGNGIVLASMYVALLMKAKESDGEYKAFSVFGCVLITANMVMIVAMVVEAFLSGGQLADSILSVEKMASPVHRPTLVSSKRVQSIHPSSIFDDGKGEMKYCD